jgi:ribose transport system substrate-binding protein
MKMRAEHRWVATGVAALFATTLSACGGSGAGGATEKSDDNDVARYQARLDEWYEGTFKEPEGPVVEAPKDKDVWLVANGLGVEYAVRVADAAKQAGEDLGWDVHVFDAKFDPNQMLTGVQQAVVADADGIIVLAIDCATVKNGAQQVLDAGIPIIGIEAADCDPGLYTGVVSYAGGQSFTDWVGDYGRAQAAWVIAKTEGQTKAVLNTESDTETTRLMSKGQYAEFKECPTCEILDDVTWSAADFGPKLQEKIQQAMVKHPDANAFLPSYDAVMTQSGGAQAIKSTGRLAQLTVGGGEGSSAGVEQIRNGEGMQMCAGQSAEWETYSAFDALVRTFLDRDVDEVDTGNGIQVCDKDHNMPAEGEAYTPPIDFEAAYQRLWGLG